LAERKTVAEQRCWATPKTWADALMEITHQSVAQANHVDLASALL